MRTILLISLIAVVVLAVGIGALYTTLQQPAKETATPTTIESTTSPPQLATTWPTPTTTATKTPAATEPAATTTPPGKVVEPLKLKSIKDVFSHFSHMKLVVREINGSKVTATTFEYMILPGEAISGEQTLKVDIIVVSPTGESQTLTFWLTQDYTTVLKIAAPDGTVYEGASATQLGSVLLNQLNMFVGPFLETENINYVISKSEVPAEIPGWVITSSEHTSITLSNKDYPGYTISLKNVNDNTSQAALVNVKVAELEKGLWLVAYIKAVMNDGVTYEFILNELTLHT